MNSPAKGSCLIGLGVFVALVGRPARAADGPLLVVVEAPPALDADAAEIRRAIGAELRSETIAPMKTPREAPERALIVALDRDRIAMSLRAGDATPVARSIPAPPERAARLRAIAWLAGNLARDQVSPLVVDLAENPPAPLVTPLPPAPSSAEPGAETQPKSVPQEPPPFEATAGIIAAQSAPQPMPAERWSIGATTGPSISTYGLGHALRQSIFGSWNLKSSLYDVFHDYGTIWRVEARHRTDGSRLFSGVALEGSASDQSEIVGGTGFVGSTLQIGHWHLEGSLGAGIDLGERLHVDTFIVNGYPTTTYDSFLRPGLYAAGSLAAAHPLFESVSLVLSFDAHVSVIDEYDGYLATLIGLRYRL